MRAFHSILLVRCSMFTLLSSSCRFSEQVWVLKYKSQPVVGCGILWDVLSLYVHDLWTSIDIARLTDFGIFQSDHDHEIHKYNQNLTTFHHIIEQIILLTDHFRCCKREKNWRLKIGRKSMTTKWFNFNHQKLIQWKQRILYKSSLITLSCSSRPLHFIFLISPSIENHCYLFD